MPKSNIGKALASLSQTRNGPERCDKIAKCLMLGSSTRVKQISKEVNFGWLKWTMRSVQIIGGRNPA
jgi:hypothetical protein